MVSTGVNLAGMEEYITTEDDCKRCDGDGWKTKNPLLEEYVDCLHFILSIGLEQEIKYFDLEPMQWRGIIESFNCLFTGWDENDECYHENFEVFLGLGELLGFTWEQIEQAYLTKNEINHQRQATGY